MEIPFTQPLIALFLVGLLGGVHCVGMCGALVTAFGVSDIGPQSTPRLLIINLGRMTTYVLLGTIAGLIGHGVSQLFALPVLLYVFAQLMLIGLGLYLAGWWSFIPWVEKQGKFLWQFVQAKLGKYIPPRRAHHTYLVGILWGFIPCGLVYSALSSALLSGSAVQGGVDMLAFWLGTLPNLLILGRFSFLLRQWMGKPLVKKVAGAIIIILGVYGLMHLLPAR